ncbi:alpha-ketoacid dehydrogenase subunit beta [Virgibacillus pantothenticus]|uniref:alpha-ketoacid dehydrogenase subunit beta n=1 Tax=Virgibacillus pantothenticus TaxID=1473 RepID=UPI001C2406FB|nr:alpha-ketoacid dehydrogenase subunit beta [Virgibacillus pantothenticus]MBU8564876.1 alpha-ketoacid dehydrogenase subunit beta [Virgibacillus pantothenticus]MBU8599184.1 alpha-ketoacid dehydrogenase subunit beta [Virgibacillus pantothenticus]MBU8633413.1 alpha-ketoacid dehydrogenase subunit beta [Virgibacillus pantothenticus]MBU8640926.1 alpha-ketoacid dehydrogenase subunit beta [Virgibacillus pantothenticus]MBU8645145.1 alpha-ketoacid dehydrogenase subunit beta [Virgibacillus pantothenticu
MARKLTFSKAINEAMDIAMERDNKVILIGEDVAGGATVDHLQDEEAWGGVFGVTKGLGNKYGRKRVIDMPIAEAGYMGAAVAAAVTGLRPISELMFNDFIGSAMDEIMNQGAKIRYMFGGKAEVPLTIRTSHGAGAGAAAQHSQSLYGILTAIPGLKVVVPSNPYDAKGLLLTAIEDNDIVAFFEDKTLYSMKGEVPEGYYTIPLGQAEIKRNGDDLTIVAIGKMVHVATDAANQLAKQGVESEIIDPRSLSPLDEDTILQSVEKTGRLLIIDEANPRCNAATDISALVVDKGFDSLDAPIKMVTAPHAPTPFATNLEQLYIPQAETVVQTAKEMIGELTLSR